MPPPATPPTSPAPPSGGTGVPGQPPFGSSPVTMPTPSRGAEAGADAMIRTAVDILTKSLSTLGPAGAATEKGQAIMKAIQSIAKHVPPGTVTPGAQNTAMQQHMMQQRQESPLLAQLAAMRGGGGSAPPGAGAPGPSPSPGGGAAGGG